MRAKSNLSDTQPLDADAWRRLATSFIADGRIPDAIDAIARAQLLCPPRSGQVLLEVSKVLEILSAHAQTAPLQLRMARTCAAAGFIDRGILHVERALDHDQDNPDAHRDLSELLWKRGRRDESIDALHRVLWMRRDDVDTALLIAERLLELGRDKSARMIVRRITDKIPPTGEAELRIGRLLRKCAMPEQALWRLEKAVVLLSESAHAHFELALAYTETKRLAAAVDELAETARLRPDWGEPLRRLAFLQRELGRISEAAEIEAQLESRPVTLDIDEVIAVEDTDEFNDTSELSGHLRLMPVAELLQFLAQRNLTGILRVTSDLGVGSIEIYRGTVIGAQLDGITVANGERDERARFQHCQTVIGEMICWTEGQIDFVSSGPYDREPPVRFEVPHLLLETMRMLDEAKG